jgi:hypothetical protein
LKILTRILDVLKKKSTNADMKAFYLVSFQICCLNIAISKIFISKLQVEKILDEEKICLRKSNLKPRTSSLRMSVVSYASVLEIIIRLKF